MNLLLLHAFTNASKVYNLNALLRILAGGVGVDNASVLRDLTGVSRSVDAADDAMGWLVNVKLCKKRLDPKWLRIATYMYTNTYISIYGSSTPLAIPPLWVFHSSRLSVFWEFDLLGVFLMNPPVKVSQNSDTPN